MKQTTQRYWQVWQAWAKWPVFRVMVWVMLAQWIGTLLFIHQQEWIGERFYYGTGPAYGTLLMWLGRYFPDLAHFLGVFLNWLYRQLYYETFSPLAFAVKAIPICMVVAMPVVIVGRVKSQMIDWHSALTPQYRRPHLVVAALIAATTFIAMACAPKALDVTMTYVNSTSRIPTVYFDALSDRQVFSYIGPPPQSYVPFRPGGVLMRERIYVSWEMNSAPDGRFFTYRAFKSAMFDLAVALLVAALIGFAIIWLSPWLAVAMTALIWLLIVGVGIGRSWGLNDFFWRIQVNLDQTVYLLLFDIGLCAALWIVLSRVPAGGDSVVADERMPWLAALLGGGAAKPGGALSRAGVFARARHRRQIGLGHRFVWILAAYLALIISAAPAMNSGYGLWFRDGGFAFCTVIVAVITSSLSIGLSWPQRFTALGDVELLRPSRRNGFARELGLAMLSDTIKIFVLTLGAMLIPVAIWSPWSLHNPSFWIGFASALLCAPFVFGVIIWAMPHNSIAATMGAMIAAIVAAALLVEQAFAEHRLAPSMLFAAVGVVLATHAYRRWVTPFRGAMS
jgi:hypothetical protein